MREDSPGWNSRVAGVSEPWLQSYVNANYQSMPRLVKVGAKKKGSLSVECDQMWSLVGKLGKKQWMGLALETTTRDIVGV